MRFDKMETYAEYLLQLMSQSPSWGDLGLVVSFLSFIFFIVYFDCLQALNHPFQLPLPSSMDFEFSLCHLHITLNQRILYVTVWSWNCKKSVE